jgi:serine/threonine protein kinase
VSGPLASPVYRMLISIRGFDGPSPAPGKEPDDLLSSEKRQDSSNWNASTMSLLDFRERSIRFHWENTDKSHRAFPDGEPWPLQQKGKLGKSGGKRKAIVYAAEVTREKHGFADMVALKIVKYSTDTEKYHANIEIKNLQKLCHNHIVAFVGSYTQGNHIGILMFPVAAWDLEQFLESENVGKRLNFMRPWFSCLAGALAFLHKRSKPFKHRDIKPANILIDCSNSIYLTDFGISKEYASDAATVTRGDGRFTVKYASPQTVDQVDQGVESDIFSLGCVFLEMATVILRTCLEDMFEYLGSHTGKVWYHQVYNEAKGWTEELKKSVRKQSDPLEHERHLANFGLEMIISMIMDSANGNAPDLEDVCKSFNPLRYAECQSCSKQVCSAYSVTLHLISQPSRYLAGLGTTKLQILNQFRSCLRAPIPATRSPVQAQLHHLQQQHILKVLMKSPIPIK